MDYEYMKYQLLQKEMSLFNLNDKQKIAYNLMVNGSNIFLTGSGGVGKSHLIKTFRQSYNNKRIIAMTSLTGVSAILINGTTLHSYFGIGLGTGSLDFLITKIQKSSYFKKRWIKLDTLIIDEISMLDPELFDKLENIARIIRKNEKPFGGIQLILSGDWAQLPVVKKTMFCFEADTWSTCIKHTIYLTEIVRQNDKNFQKCLNNIRMGNVTSEVKKILLSRVGVDLTNEFGIKPTQFFPTNAMVDYINEQELDILSEKGLEFYQYDMTLELHKFVPNRQYIIDKFIKDCPAIEILQLCVGSQVMLIYNLNIEQGLVNGSRGVITSFVDDKPIVKFVDGHEIMIDYNVWEIEMDGNKFLTITQIPLRLGYAFSIHKAQGLTLDYAIVDITNCFEYGQAYCALSRVKNLEGLSILGLDFDKIRCNPKVLEFYKQFDTQ